MDFIAEYLDHLVELRRADATIETYEVLLHLADAASADGLIYASEPELRAWVRAAKSKSSAALRTVVVRGFFAWACDPRRSPRPDFNPALYLPRIRVPRRYPRPAPTEILGDILTRARPHRRLLFLLASHAGARCTEIAAIDREHVTEQDTLLHGKGDITRLVPTHPVLWEAVRERPPGPLVCRPDGRRATRQNISDWGNYELDRLGYPQITMHRWRHWFGTQAHDAVHDLAAVQELLGHASPATTRIYVMANRRTMQAAVAGLPRLT